MANKAKHGHALAKGETATYRCWKAMKARCLNPNVANYKYYGGKGVRVCPRWIDSFSSFLEDMGEKPEGMTLDKDILGDGFTYDQASCCWATPSEQMLHRSYPGAVTFEGRTQSISAWERETGLAVSMRLRAGWTEEQALTLPKYSKRPLP